MSVFAPETVGAFEIVEIGARHCAVFSTFTIPAPTRDEAIRRGRAAIAQSMRNQKIAAAATRDRMVDFGKAVAAADRMRDEAERARTLARRPADRGD